MREVKRLIDADELMDQMTANFQQAFQFGCDTSEFSIVEETIEDAPTVDAVEVVHSQWDSVFYERNGTLASYSHICPVCKYLYRDTRFNGHNYCPNCGTKMDEKP